MRKTKKSNHPSTENQSESNLNTANQSESNLNPENQSESNLNPENQELNLIPINDQTINFNFKFKLELITRDQLISVLNHYSAILISKQDYLCDEIISMKNYVIQDLTNLRIKLDDNEYEASDESSEEPARKKSKSSNDINQAVLVLTNDLRIAIINHLIKNQFSLNYFDRITKVDKLKIVEDNKKLISILLNLPIIITTEDISTANKLDQLINRYEFDRFKSKIKKEITEIKESILQQIPKLKNELNYLNDKLESENLIKSKYIYPLRLTFEFDDIRNFFIKNNLIDSNFVIYLDFQFSFQLESFFDETTGKKYLGIFLLFGSDLIHKRYTNLQRLSFQFDCSFEIHLVSNDKNYENIIAKYDHVFTSSLGVGKSKFISCEDLFKDNVYVNDDKITVQAYILTNRICWFKNVD